MKCSKCQHENPEDARFCNGCGNKLEEVSVPAESRLTLEAERKRVTALFSDLSGYTDMTMPFMTGAELSQKVLGICPRLPIILCTGHSELINREKALAMGIKEYFEKPVNKNKMLLTVRKILDTNNIRDS